MPMFYLRNECQKVDAACGVDFDEAFLLTSAMCGGRPTVKASTEEGCGMQSCYCHRGAWRGVHCSNNPTSRCNADDLLGHKLQENALHVVGCFCSLQAQESVDI